MIEKAIQAEQQYIQNRINGIETTPLIDILKEYGFNSLEEYYKQKTEFEFSSLDFHEMNTTSDVAFQVIGQILRNEKPILLFENHATPFIYHGNEEYNHEAAEKLGITVYEGGYMGGTIVGGIGDLSIGIFFPSHIEYRSKYFLNKLVEIFQKHNVNAEINNNDIMIDGKKVIGTACLETENYYGFVAYVSFSDKSELVKQVCGDAIKQPGFITGMTLEKLEEELREWLL